MFQGNTDLKFSHETFDKLTAPEVFEPLLKDKNKNVRKLFDQWLLKQKIKNIQLLQTKSLKFK